MEKKKKKKEHDHLLFFPVSIQTYVAYKDGQMVRMVQSPNCPDLNTEILGVNGWRPASSGKMDTSNDHGKRRFFRMKRDGDTF